MASTSVKAGTAALIAAWDACIQSFDIIQKVTNYGIDYEILRVKLEVERVRLIAWGEMLGMSSSGGRKSDERLNDPRIEAAVASVLACIRYLFKNTDELQAKYGLKKESLGSSFGKMSLFSGSKPSDSATIIGTESATLETVFAQSYDTLQQSAKEHKKSVSIGRKTKWAISDKAKFTTLISEIKSFNDDLLKLIPDLSARTAQHLKTEIDASTDVQRLQLIQEASQADNDDLSDMASVRLVSLGSSTLKASSGGSVKGSSHAPLAKPSAEPAVVPSTTSQQDAGLTAAEQHLENQLKEMYKAVEKFKEGSVSFTLTDSDSYSSKRSVYTTWNETYGDDYDYRMKINEEKCGRVLPTHPSFDLYRRRRYIRHARVTKYSDITAEDYVFFDIESDTKYEHLNPGTVTATGYGLEGWDYEETSGPPISQTILISHADTPAISGAKILRRLDQLRSGCREIGWNPRVEYDELVEYIGTGGTTWVNPDDALKMTNQILDIYRLLNNRYKFKNFLETSSFAASLLAPGPNDPGMWDILWQIIIARELARRHDQFPDSSLSGLTPRIIASIIIGDLWSRNVRVVLAPLPASQHGTAVELPDIAEVDKPYSLVNKDMQFHSLVHEQQAEGLQKFAQLMKWPYMDELREYSEDCYSNLRGGATVDIAVWDWAFGLMLPGKWASFKIMTAAIHSTPSLKHISTSLFYETGLSLKQQSYWRYRTVLGRVLGSLPSVKSACGWIGPCPPVNGPHEKHIRLKARKVIIPKLDKTQDAGNDDGIKKPRQGETIPEWIAEMRDASHWTTPQAPITQFTNTIIESIDLKALPLETSVAGQDLTEDQKQKETEYRASIRFKVDNQPPVTMTLYSNPVFVSLPACIRPVHLVHRRVIAKYQRNVFNAENLKDITDDDIDSKLVLVINANGRGAETLARAWCAETGRNAIVRRSETGPCYTCAYNAADSGQLRTGTLIWVS